MQKEETVKIPLTLFYSLVDLLEHTDVSAYDYPFTMIYDDVFSALTEKRQRLHLRQTYASIISAKDEDARFAARMQYLQEKRSISENIYPQ